MSIFYKSDQKLLKLILIFTYNFKYFLLSPK